MNELRMKEMKEEKEMGLFFFKVVVNRTMTGAGPND